MTNLDTKIKYFIVIVKNEGYSRIPVFKNNLDNIIEIIYIKDLF